MVGHFFSSVQKSFRRICPGVKKIGAFLVLPPWANLFCCDFQKVRRFNCSLEPYYVYELEGSSKVPWVSLLSLPTQSWRWQEAHAGTARAFPLKCPCRLMNDMASTTGPAQRQRPLVRKMRPARLWECPRHLWVGLLATKVRPSLPYVGFGKKPVSC